MTFHWKHFCCCCSYVFPNLIDFRLERRYPGSHHWFFFIPESMLWWTTVWKSPSATKSLLLDLWMLSKMRKHILASTIQGRVGRQSGNLVCFSVSQMSGEKGWGSPAQEKGGLREDTGRLECSCTEQGSESTTTGMWVWHEIHSLVESTAHGQLHMPYQ